VRLTLFGSDARDDKSAALRLFFFFFARRSAVVIPSERAPRASEGSACGSQLRYRRDAPPPYEYYGGGRLECYWTSQRFRGWIPTTVGGAEADIHGVMLHAMGF
jgi:hypothetical protein